MKVHIDFETRSLLDLGKVGVHEYAAHPSTEILCAAYSIDCGPTKLWRKGTPAPQNLIDAVNAGAEFHAWNAQFERVMWRDCWARPGGPMEGVVPEPKQWHCSMARAAVCGLPSGLAVAAEALQLTEAKDMGGRALMLKMTRPRRIEPDGTVIWGEEPDKLERLAEYCKNDVRVEQAITSELSPMPPQEREIYLEDQEINDLGVGLDIPLAKALQQCAQIAIHRADEQLSRLTNGSVNKISQVKKLTEWIRSQGIPIESLDKRRLPDMAVCDLPAAVAAALKLRAAGAKSSVAKLQTMLSYASTDGRMRGMFQYHGAATGRWSARGPQPQNFPRGTVDFAEQLIPLVRSHSLDDLELFAPPLEVVSSLLRPTLIPAKNFRFIGADYVAIEPRVLAWIAGETHLLKAFRNGEDIYKSLASKVYNVPISAITNEQRSVGKTAQLGLGYQMGAKKFHDQCKFYGIEIDEESCATVVMLYRENHKQIKALWRGLQDAAIAAVTLRWPHSYGHVTFAIDRRWLLMTLPSGRSLYYLNPRIFEKEAPWEPKDGGQRELIPALVVDHYSSITHQWAPREMYGGLWTENAVQATARDILAEAMLALKAEGFQIVMTIHDEIVAEVPAEIAEGRLARFVEIMKRVPAWAHGCPIGVEAWVGRRYRK